MCEGFNLDQLLALWCDYNTRYFQGELSEPEIELVFMGDALGRACPPSVYIWNRVGWVRSRQREEDAPFRIWIAPGLSRDRMANVLLHEMIHQWIYEGFGERGMCRAGHGQTFTSKANEIGACLGMPMVRPANGRTQKYLQDAAYWPPVAREHMNLVEHAGSQLAFGFLR